MKNRIGTEESFNEYRRFVEFLAKNEIPLKFPNTSPKHAAVVLSNILDTSNEVYIYDDTLDGDIAYEHEDFMKSLENFCANENKKLTFITKPINDDEDNQILYKHIKKMKEKGKPKADIKVYEYNQEFINNIKEVTNKIFSYKGNINFAIGDKSYRIERFPEKDRYEAECNFYSPVKVQTLKSAILNNIKNCKTLLN